MIHHSFQVYISSTKHHHLADPPGILLLKNNFGLPANIGQWFTYDKIVIGKHTRHRTDLMLNLTQPEKYVQGVIVNNIKPKFSPSKKISY